MKIEELETKIAEAIAHVDEKKWGKFCINHALNDALRISKKQGWSKLNSPEMKEWVGAGLLCVYIGIVDMKFFRERLWEKVEFDPRKKRK